MTTGYANKSTVEEIRERFDKDVERFANLETGQQSTLDAPLTLELITSAAQSVNPAATTLLDLGCGAGNYTLKMLSKVPNLSCTLVDLSLPMLQKAQERVTAETTGNIQIVQSDMRELALEPEQYDIVLAGAVLHHLRDDADWELVFSKLYQALKPGGSFWVSDLVSHEVLEVNGMFRGKYGDYLASVGGTAYREQVLAYIEKEDSPRPVSYQLELMKKVGFSQVEVLHKNLCFAAFGGVK
ncbi:class I SAM-dependent methyltransferase [Pontibacter qinzhouensis]|uniref:Class I SAM-dependent methyltransferase n=1 Tax=Pontibacter qinzhouensis TaxID=2603253 RepID=A0A5C8J1E8_9BACT|nr:class I SAM-dependent methyltransferase [Pontibacter qinzhouensis]TXK28256.1 class I SAM-dependent methyltransferase [Pontibacter qinzhouensis]